MRTPRTVFQALRAPWTNSIELRIGHRSGDGSVRHVADMQRVAFGALKRVGVVE